jgi:hypothetical protein
LDITNKYTAIQYGGCASRGEIESLDKENDLHREAINRFYQLKRLPLTTAIWHTRRGEVFFDRNLHGMIQKLHYPDYGHGRHPDVEYGFITDDGKWLTRTEASFRVKELGGIPFSMQSLMAGEEWVPMLKTESEAEELAGFLHHKGYEQAINKAQLFEHKGINLEYARLLRIATDKYPILEEAARNGN